jgi:hypothetical protein
MRCMRVAALIFLGVLAGAANAADSPLIGTWRLVAFEDQPQTGPSVFPLGKDPKGLLIYDATGHMSLQLMTQPHPKVASGDDAVITPEEKQALFDSYIAYFGTYAVDSAKGVVVHQVEGDLYDVYIGRAEERPFELDGDRLTLKPRWVQDEQQWLGIRVFERIKK